MSYKQTLASGTTSTSAAGTVTYSVPGNADVFAGTTTTASALMPPEQVKRPGVFTAGTAPEGTASNPSNNSNS